MWGSRRVFSVALLLVTGTGMTARAAPDEDQNLVVGPLRIDIKRLIDEEASVAKRMSQGTGGPPRATVSRRGRRVAAIVAGVGLAVAGVALLHEGFTYKTRAQKDCENPALSNSAKIAACRTAIDQQPLAPTLLVTSGSIVIGAGGGLLIWGLK